MRIASYKELDLHYDSSMQMCNQEEVLEEMKEREVKSFEEYSVTESGKGY